MKRSELRPGMLLFNESMNSSSPIGLVAQCDQENRSFSVLWTARPKRECCVSEYSARAPDVFGGDSIEWLRCWLGEEI